MCLAATDDVFFIRSAQGGDLKVQILELSEQASEERADLIQDKNCHSIALDEHTKTQVLRKKRVRKTDNRFWML